MKIDTLKELERLIQLCRKTGVTSVTVDGISLELDPTYIKQARKRSTRAITASNEVRYVADATPDEISMPDSLSDEELLFYSSDNNSSSPGEQ